jgi:hypothetical protein
MYAFWAQALDNTSSDHCDGTDELGNKIRPEAVQQLFYRVGTKGRERFSLQGVRLVQYKDEFTLEVPTLSHDRIGRGAPITMYYDFSGAGTLGSGDELFYLLKRFAANIEREIGDHCRPLVLQAYDNIKKKNADRLILAVVCVSLVAVLVIIGLWVIHPASHN